MRINRLKERLKSKRLDFALFHNLGVEPNPNMSYFSSYTGTGALIIPKSQDPFLVVPEMEFERAKGSMIKRVYVMDKKKFFESVLVIIKKRKIQRKKIAIDNSSFSLNAYKKLKKPFGKARTKDISLDCLELRQLKTTMETKILRKSCSCASNILRKAVNVFKDFKTESEVAAFLEYEAKKLGLHLSFSPIIASGISASMPHYEPRNVKLKKGFCVMDFGVKYKNYCSDITRTIYIGKPSKKEKQIYDLLLRTQENLIKNIKLNDNCGKIYQNCLDYLGKYSRYFIHGLGHGIGTQIHELPNLTLDSKDKIQKNAVFTIEPGIYILKKLGIRIEDSVLMRDKPKILTGMTKELVIK